MVKVIGYSTPEMLHLVQKWVRWAKNGKKSGILKIKDVLKSDLENLVMFRLVSI